MCSYGVLDGYEEIAYVNVCFFFIFELIVHFNVFKPLDPTDISPQKALDEIGSRLQKQYEKWQPRVS